MSFPSVLMKRELGMPGVRSRIEEALEKRIANRLTDDLFHSDIIEVPTNSSLQIYRNKDLAAVFSTTMTDQKVLSLALWSLITKSKLWELETNLTDINSCDLSESGLILVAQHSSRTLEIFYDGKHTKSSPIDDWNSIHLIGSRILGILVKLEDPNDHFSSLNHFYGEFDHEGNCLKQHQLDSRRSTHIYACDGNYWVRLSESVKRDRTILIEVVDRIRGIMNTFKVTSTRKERLICACILHNRLIYGKNEHWDAKTSEYIKPSIGIVDLIEGTVLEEFPTGSITGKILKIVANKHFIAWTERGIPNGCVKYLDLSTKEIKHCANIDQNYGQDDAVLNMVGSVLSVSQDRFRTVYYESPNWKRLVIDMTSGKIKCEVRYQIFGRDKCSIENGILLINDITSMYIENFMSDDTPSKESQYRIQGYF